MNNSMQNHGSRTARATEPSACPSGVVLMITIVALVVLAILGYTLASRVASQRHRDNYVIDHTNACYARDSALKYALAVLEDLNVPSLVSRPNEPDFSDLFHLSEQDYSQMLAQWAEELAKTQTGQAEPNEDGNTAIYTDANDSNKKYAAGSGLADINDINDINNLKIRGPYGPSWPCVTEPVEFDIGTTHIKIETEDENAKYPAGWAIIDNENVQREAQAGMQTFFEWMGYDSEKIKTIGDQLKQIAAIKPFKVEFKTTVQRTAVTTDAPSAKRGARAQKTTYKTTEISPADAMAAQTKDFSKLFHSSLLDLQMLAEPTIISETRKESAMKYMGLWGTTQVNINTAPRQVLEAAFTFGGDAQQIADAIIKNRRQKPFETIDELKKDLFQFSGSIDKCSPYITTSSNMFSIHVTAVSGAAKVSAIVVVLKNGGKTEKIAILNS